MDQFELVEYNGSATDFSRRGVDLFSVADQRQSGGLAARVHLDAQGLRCTAVKLAVDEPDSEGHEAMNARTPAREQQPRAFLAARHQRLARPVQNEYRQLQLLVFNRKTSGALPLRAW
jgi:hypothetical protein